MSEPKEKLGGRVGCEASQDGFKGVHINAAGSITASHSRTFDPAEEMLPQLLDFISQMKAKFGEFSSLGVAVPGLVDREHGRLAYSASLRENSIADLARNIGASAGVKAVIDNDANAAAYGEFKLGAGRGANDLFYATVGSGVGGSFIFGGKIWRGVSGYAGEFGYIAINSDGMRLEDVASSANIVRRTRNRFNQDHTSALSRIDEREIGFADIIAAAEKGDDFALLMLERTGMYIGTAVASVINLLNVERIIIGGEILKGGQRVLDAITKRSKELSFGPAFDDVRFAASELGDTAAAVGAALLSVPESADDNPRMVG